MTTNSGVYKIINVITGDFYVGSAIHLRNRWNNHRYNFNLNRHGNMHLQLAWNKYGENNFEFSVLEYCEKEQVVKREQFYIDLLKPEYNICKVAGSCLGIKRSEETKRKIVEANKGKHTPSEETKRKRIETRRMGKCPKNRCLYCVESINGCNSELIFREPSEVDAILANKWAEGNIKRF